MADAEKAYKNLDFLNSPSARLIRINCEYEEPRMRFRREHVENTVVLFGSARTLPRAVAESRLAQVRAELARDPKNEELKQEVRYYEDARLLAREITLWGQGRAKGKDYLICTGGGPGIMEAGNRGASDVDGGRSVGLGISLPFEERLNQYVTPELGFVFHYFFTRKYWFAYLAKAMVVFPGGFGTLDEFAEMLTLRQTGKITKPIPTVLFGKEYWGDVLNVEKMVKWGTISPKDLDLFHYTDDVDDAVAFLTGRLSGGK